jgi:hypothetical protein
VHASAYDKNLEEQVRPAVVPDDVIGGAANPDRYWVKNELDGKMSSCFSRLQTSHYIYT